MRSLIAGILVVASLLLRCQGAQWLLEEECGDFSPIVGRMDNAENAKIATHPYMAYLYTPTEFQCSGSLINHWFVLTTAHCIPDDLNIIVRLGEYNRRTKEDCVGRSCQGATKEYQVDMAFKHDQYDPDQHTDNIGLLRLAERVEYENHVSPICVFVNTAMQNRVAQLTWLTATSWGDVLKELKLQRLPKEECSNIYGRGLTFDEICAGKEYDKGGLCEGDLGAAQVRLMWHNRRKRSVQLGIASGMNSECEKASILTDVVGYGDWIKRVVHLYGHVEETQSLSEPSVWIDYVSGFYKPL
ncbi:serine protease grass-like [Drosophila ficusphila]|uniref:serine protease grass-like n=1 Tax=Drosophila ficusphila TaxID=30025 RepID=UPI0007E6E0A4|nr:serine protease grass-like [Drosophila ficusphila]